MVALRQARSRAALYASAFLTGIAATAAPAQAQSTAKVSAETEPAPAQSDELRLATIGYRLTTANGDRCDRPDMATGLIFHDVGGYDADTRAAVTRAYGLGRGFGVLRRVAGSSADRAGLRPGDEIVALGGRDLADFAADAIAERASPLRTERFAALLGGALRQGPVSLTVKRGGALVAVSLEGEKACGGSFVAVPGGDLNAWADGRSVAVTARMMRFAADDQELAFVAAHEMAHNILRHASAQEDNGIARGKAAEIEADALAVELLARAGYDLTAPERFLRRSAAVADAAHQPPRQFATDRDRQRLDRPARRGPAGACQLDAACPLGRGRLRAGRRRPGAAEHARWRSFRLPDRTD